MLVELFPRPLLLDKISRGARGNAMDRTISSYLYSVHRNFPIYAKTPPIVSNNGVLLQAVQLFYNGPCQEPLYIQNDAFIPHQNILLNPLLKQPSPGLLQNIPVRHKALDTSYS